MIQAVVFNVGGVLAKDVWEHLLLDPETGVASTYNLPKAFVREVGSKLWGEYELKPIPSESRWEKLEEEYWEKFIAEFRDALPSSATTDQFINMTEGFICDVNDEEMVPLLQRLQAGGVDIALCSNNNEFWFARQKHKLGFERFFN